VANHRIKPLEIPICHVGSYCTKTVCNGRSLYWAASVIQRKFRNIRRRSMVVRIRNAFFASGIMTKRVISLDGFLKHVLALQNFYRKLKAKQLNSKKELKDLVNEDINKKSLMPRKIKQENKKTISINAVCLYTKTIRREEVAPKSRIIIRNRVAINKEVRSLRFFRYVMLLQKAIKRFLELRKKQSHIVKIGTFTHFTKDIIRKTNNAKLRKNITAKGVLTKKVIDFGKLIRTVIALQNFYRKIKPRRLQPTRIIEDSINEDINKKCKPSRTIKNLTEEKCDRRQVVHINDLSYFTKNVRTIEVAPKPRAVNNKYVLINKRVKSLRIVNIVILLQKAVKKFLAQTRIRKSTLSIASFCNSTEDIRTQNPEPTKKAILKLFTHFTKTIRINAKIISRPVLPYRKLIDKKCTSKRVFVIIMLLQRAIKRFLASRNIYIEKPVIDETKQFATKLIASRKVIHAANVIKKFCTAKPESLIHKSKETIKRSVLFTKDYRIHPKIFKRPLLIDRKYLRKKCFSPKIFRIIMLLQKAVRQFLEKLHVRPITLPVIEDFKQFTKKVVISKKYIDAANKIKGFMKPKPKIIVKSVCKPVINKQVRSTKEIRRSFVTRQRPNIIGSQLSKTCKSKAAFSVIMLLQKAVKKLLGKNKEAITLPIFCQKDPYTVKKVKSRIVDDYARRIQLAWRRYRNRPIPQEVTPIIKKKAIPTRMSKKVTSGRIIKLVIYLQRFFRNLLKRLPAKEIATPEASHNHPMIRPVHITKSYRLNVVTKKRPVLPNLCRKTKASVKLTFIFRLQKIIRKFLKCRVKPEGKSGLNTICLFTKKIKYYPQKKVISIQALMKNFILLQRRKKEYINDYIKKMALQNSIFQLKKVALYTRRRLYNIDFVITLERQAVKVAQELVFMKLAEHAKLNKNVLNELDERENYYYRTIKGLRNLAQTIDMDSINREFTSGITPTFNLVISKFPQEVRNIYSYKWFTHERLHDDNDLWQTFVYRNKTDPNFVNMIQYLLREHNLPNSYIEHRIKNTPINNLTIFALLHLAELFLYDYYNDLVCKSCYCKKEDDDTSDCHCKCHERLSVKMTLSRKKSVDEDELDPLARISANGLRPKRKYDAAYDQLKQQKEMEDRYSPKKKCVVNDRDPVNAVQMIKHARNNYGSIMYRDIDEDTVDIGNMEYIIDEKVYH
jgi:hypothetical protein